MNFRIKCKRLEDPDMKQSLCTDITVHRLGIPDIRNNFNAESEKLPLWLLFSDGGVVPHPGQSYDFTCTN
jgi:hypothetical protein